MQLKILASFIFAYDALYWLSSHILQPIGNIAERFYALCLKDSGVLYEDPYIQVSIFSQVIPFACA